MLVATAGSTEIAQQLQAELSSVERLFATELLSDLSCVNHLVGHIERYRGKMLRPTLVLAGGMAAAGPGSGIIESHRVVASVAEMIHMATLIHDDILDEARVRRRGATINELAGNETAVILGDYLVSHAYRLCSSLNQPWINHLMAEVTNLVCEGELLQLANRNNWGLDEPIYLEIIRRKTASLCGGCCRFGGLLAGGSTELAQSLHDYGERLGIAFQIVDDLLDLTGDPTTVGKTLGRDLQKGKLTLPLIHFLATAESGDRGKMLAIVEDETRRLPVNGLEARHLETIRRLLAATGSVDYSRGVAARFVREAQDSMNGLLDTPARRYLADLAQAVLNRQF